MARLYSDLIDGAGRRYYFNLESAPGGVSPATAGLTIVGLAPNIFEQVQVFRTPATAALTFAGQLPKSQTILLPAQAPLAYGGQIPTLAKFVTITNTFSLDYGTPQDNLPTVQTIMLLAPGRAQIAIASLQPNVTQGGNIGFVSPGVGLIVMQGREANFPKEAGLGSINLVGLLPTLHCEIVITPDPAQMSMDALTPRVSTPFTWIEDDRVSTPVWIDEPRA
jgi:hypothetical protein